MLENRDFLCVAQNCATALKGAAVGKDFILSLDATKHIAMIERTDKGYEAREYFIECEKKLKSLVTSKERYLLDIVMADNVRERAIAMNEYEIGYVKPLEQFKEQALPKVSYYDNVLMSPGLVTITQIAKDYGMTAIDFNKLLESLHIQYKQSGQWLLYHHYAKEGYTQSSIYITERKIVHL